MIVARPATSVALLALALAIGAPPLVSAEARHGEGRVLVMRLEGPISPVTEIGRASCRERVCQYV